MATQTYKFENETVTADPSTPLSTPTGVDYNGVISVDQLKPATPITLPDVPSTSGITSDGLVTGVTEAQKSLSDYISSLTPPTTQLDTQNQAILDEISFLTGQGTGKSQATAQAKIDAGVPNLNKQLSELNGQISIGNAEYSRLQLEKQARKDALEANSRGITTGVLMGQQGAVERQYNSELALKAAEIGMNAARAQAVAGNITTALQIAQNAVDAKYGPIEDDLKIKKAQLDALKPQLDKQETIQANALLQKYNDEQKKIEEDKANQKSVAEMVIQASGQGAPQDIVKLASEAKTPLEAAKILGKYSGDYLKYEMLKEQIKTEKLQQSKISADINKIKQDIVNNNPNISPVNAGKYAGALSVILGSDKFTKEQKASITNAINNGQDPFSVIKNQAKNIMGQTLATDLGKAETAKSQLQSIDILLTRYYANGGKTGVFKGNYEKALNNLGQVSDPKLVSIATEIALAMQEYRLAVTGTAASVQEDARIDNVFPGINSSQGLNWARTEGLLKSFDQKVDASYRNVLGNSYDEIKNLEVQSKAPTVNPFSQAIGQQGSSIPGSSIISGSNLTGLNFNIPK